MEVIVGRFIVGLAWMAQAVAIGAYGSVLLTSPAWRTVPGLALACLGLFVLGMAGVWGVSLAEEQRIFYARGKAMLSRKLGFIGHGGVLFAAATAAAALPNPGRAATWVVLASVALTAAGTWAARMQLLFLPPEDQAVIGAITQREAQARAAAFDASEKERRHARLSAIVGSLGYDLTDRAPNTPAPEPETPEYAWDIPPRKHEPVVYFIRNGNRLKIGTTTELKRRIRTLALRAENVVLLVPGGQPIERTFHAQFADLRIGNSEWFAYSGTLVAFVTAQNRLARKEEAK
ncbi:GIY-YIG nuclease family protein (plasmid) [Streptomyces zaomyceticus]|uniref:GIY-YIG nuclease family protein n=1 Tax=Streptomyces zaomyceticus TaxID=68286 RepID=UPI00324ADC4E